MGNTSYSTPQETAAQEATTIDRMRACLKEAETLLNKLEDEG